MQTRERADQGDESNHRPKPLHVLIIDDEPNVRKVDAMRLRRRGHKATVCAGPIQALNRIEAAPSTYDVVITDQVMPRMSGLDLTRTLRDRNCRIPVVITSGFSSKLTPENVQDAGAQAVIRKPFSTADIFGVLAKVLGRTDLYPTDLR
jgi:CheY-like chemotaxis protein